MDWLSHDEVAEDQLPAWARVEGEPLDGAPHRVSVCPEGLVARRGRVATALRWDDILVPISLEAPRRVLLAAARRAPRPPWLELGGRDAARIDGLVRERLESLGQRGYREVRRARPSLSADELLAQVLARRPVPGAVEVPAATPSVIKSALIGGLVGGATVGFYGLMVGPVGALVGAGVGLAGGAGSMGLLEVVRKRAIGRVLVLTPDGFVGGLDGRSVRAVPWPGVGRFLEGEDDEGRPALEVRAPDDARVARVAARWFGAPLPVIVAVAEAYRARALGEARERG